ncbi:MAG: hypothetical protein R3Y56_04725 [Akkermansia sp.]
MDEYTDSPRMKVADWGKLAQARLDELRADGELNLHPVHEKSRKLAKNAWGSAWMRQLAYCEQEGFSLAAGRSLLRHGCVLDVQLGRGTIDALVSGEELYEIHLTLDEPEAEKVEQLRSQCGAHIDSLVALLDGQIDAAVMQQLCDPEEGLLPLPHEWHMDCNCPDWNEPCPHAAAAIYAAGCLIDREPRLLFTLRGIEPSTLCEVPSGKLDDFDAQDLANTFGIDIDLA